MALESDSNLLIAALAWKMNFIDRDEFTAALSQWLEKPQQALGPLLVARGKLGEGEYALLMLAVERWRDTHAQTHEGLDQKTLIESILESLPPELSQQLGSRVADHTSVCLSSAPPALGRPTSAGQRFQILRQHAMGGLGRVFLARDDELNREVALKQIQPRFADNEDLRARFMLEAQITGGLEHPGIVPVYGLGCDAQGRPFYAMRFIRGESLKEALDRYHTGLSVRREAFADGLDLRRLLACFVHVCNTMAYAHSRGVIHRDLKPENVMLGPYGETLLVDWGLAKIVGHERSHVPPVEAPPDTLRPPSAGMSAPTQWGAAVGTLAYMSPEQAAGLVDELNPRSDIYSLGATLYAILTGRPPVCGGTVQAMRETIVLGQLTPPRHVNPAIPAPLEAICLKAMARTPDDRYESGATLAEDVEAWLADQPVRAWPEPWRVRARRWCKRHRTLVAGAGAAVVVAFASLLLGVVLLSAANERVRAAKTLAEQREQEARQNFRLAREAVDKYLTQVSEDPRLKSHDLEYLRRDLLLTARQFYQRLSEQQPGDADLRQAQAWARFRLAEITRQIGSPQEAIEALQRSLAEFATLAGEQSRDDECLKGLVRCGTNLGLLYRAAGQPEQARHALEQASARANERITAQPQAIGPRADLARIQQNLAAIDLDAKQFDAAEKACQAALAIRRELVAKQPDDASLQSDLAAAQSDLGLLYYMTQRSDAASAALTAAREIQQRLVQRYPKVLLYQSDLALTNNHLGRVYADLPDQAPAAEAAYKAALAIGTRLTGQHPSVTEYQRELARSHNNLAAFYCERGQTLEAEATFKAARAIGQRLADEGPDVPDHKNDLAATLNNLANLYSDLDRTDEALAAYGQALTLRRDLVRRFPGNADYQYHLASTYGNQGSCYSLRGQPPAAEKSYQAAADVLEELVRSYPQVTSYTVELALNQAQRGHLLSDQQRYAAALEQLRKGADLLRALPPQTNARARVDQAWRSVHRGSAEALAQLGRHKEALAEWDQALNAQSSAGRELIRLGRAESLVEVDSHRQAVDEVKALLLSAQGQGPILFRMSAICARAAAAAEKDPNLASAERTAAADAAAAIAVDVLRQAQQAGQFDSPDQRKRLTNDPAFSSLQARKDFRDFKAGLPPLKP